MDNQSIEGMVYESYWVHDINCAGTALRILARLHQLPLEKQVTAAAIGMHGAGGFRAQCGLVEGGLMFIGILGVAQDRSPQVIAAVCRDFAAAFNKSFGSLSCRVLRPGGFSPNDEPHLCEKLTVEAISFTHQFLERVAHEWPDNVDCPQTMPVAK